MSSLVQVVAERDQVAERLWLISQGVTPEDLEEEIRQKAAHAKFLARMVTNTSSSDRYISN